MHGIISREAYAQHSFTNKSFVKEKNHIQSEAKKALFQRVLPERDKAATSNNSYSKNYI